MAISKGEFELKKAIVDRIQQILDNAKNIDDISINVKAARGEVTIISYSVKEFIIPEEGGADV